jgi:acetyltransferase-like isoleucine patch superfamily enzyme
MITFKLRYAKQWIKTSDHNNAKLLKKIWFKFHSFEVPSLPVIHSSLYLFHVVIKQLFSDVMRVIYFTPLFKSRVINCPKRLYLYGGLPVVIGSLDISMGDDIKLAAMTTLSGRSVSNVIPTLEIGNNVGISCRTSISVGRKIIIGNNVLIAGNCFLAGYPGHPIDAKSRALGLPETDEQVGDIILEDDVWLATGVKVMPGVTIGQGTIVAAGSVVTKNLPNNVLAGGVPAKVIKSLDKVVGDNVDGDNVDGDNVDGDSNV